MFKLLMVGWSAYWMFYNFDERPGLAILWFFFLLLFSLAFMVQVGQEREKQKNPDKEKE